MDRYQRTEPHNRSAGAGTTMNDLFYGNPALDGDMIGAGAYAKVYKGYDTWTNTVVALKILNSGEPGEGITPTTLREITLLRRLNHDNVIKLLDVIQGSSDEQSASVKVCKIILVLEFVDMDLKQFLTNQTAPLPPDMVKNFSKQILAGLSHCHGVGVMHRDIKPQNILIGCRPSPSGRTSSPSCDQYSIKIADFGLSRSYGFTPRPLTTLVVTLWYRAPELLLGCEFYDRAVDIWSVACIMLELAHPAFKTPFPGINTLDQLYKIFYMLGTPQTTMASSSLAGDILMSHDIFPSPSSIVNRYPELLWPEIIDFPFYATTFPQWPPRAWDSIAPTLDSDGQELVSKMLAYTPHTRINADTALQHAYFQPPALISSSSSSSSSPVRRHHSVFQSPVGTAMAVGFTPYVSSSSSIITDHHDDSHVVRMSMMTSSQSSSSLSCTSDESSESSDDHPSYHSNNKDDDDSVKPQPGTRSKRTRRNRR